MLRSTALALILCASTASSAAGPPADHAQTLHYRLAWNGLQAADATVEITPGTLGETPIVTFAAEARTNRFVDLFYPFRGRARSIFTAARQIPLQFYYDREIRSVPYRTVVDFDRNAGRVRSHYTKAGVTKKQLDLDLAELFDPIAAVFRARRGSNVVGTQQGFDIFTGESNYRVELTVDGRGEVEVPAGRFDALRITPKVMKVFADRRPPDPRLRNATIWVSDDEDRLLLQIRTDIFIGAITLDLVSREVATSSPDAP